MTVEDFKHIAQQLRQPHGVFSREVGVMMNKGNRQMNLATIDELEINSNDCVLEIGMGNGFFVREILAKDETIHYIGCDYSKEMVAEAFNCNNDLVMKGQARFNLANVMKLPYCNNYFNRIFTVNTIYFWDQPETALSEIKRVLKNKGQLIISLRPKSIMDRLPLTKYGFTTFSKEDCVELITKNGFKVEGVIEKEDHDINLFGEKYRSAFMIVKAQKK